MTYKVVITGNQRYLIEDLYVGLENSFSCITSSSITSDLEKHIQFYKPEILLVNLDDDTKKLTKMMNQIQWIINDRQIIVVVIGDQEEIDLYAKTVLRPADIYLAKPLRNSTIVDTVIKFMEEYKKAKEAELLKTQQVNLEDDRKHILIVDDDPNMLALLKEQLEGKYKIATAVNGALALRFLTKKTTDLILLDYEMPIQSGPQVMTVIRNSETTKDIPIIFLTGVKDTDKIKDVLKLKPQGYLLKPIDSKKLISAISDIIG